MDQCTNVSLNRILYNSKENSELLLKNITRHSEINVTNFRSQFRKKYENKSKKEECIFRDLSKIEKQVTYLSRSTGKADYLEKMLPENDSAILNHKIASPELCNRSCAIAARESIEQVKYDINVNKNMLSLSQDQLFSNSKSFPQLTQNSNLTFNMNKLLEEDKSNALDNVNFSIPFTESTNKLHAGSIADDSNEEADNDDDDVESNEFNDKMRKNKKAYTAFEFDGDSSGLFEFSLEGEKLVSSLCGPQSKGVIKKEKMHKNKLLVYKKPSQELNFADTFKGTTIDKSTNSFLSKQLDTRMIFSNAVTSTPEKSTSNRIHEYHIHHEVKSHDQENKLVIEMEHSLNACGLSDEHAINETNDARTFLSNRTNEKKPVLSLDPCIFARAKQSQGEECVQSNVELCTLFQGNVLCADNVRKVAESQRSDDINKANKSASVPDIFSMINKFNQGKFSIASNVEAPNRNEDESQHDSTLDSCDDDISFRKSAIKGCLVFERVIKDLHIASFHDLENYCKTVKRCVSVASSMENREFTMLISELIFTFLKLADAWGILNSYFGESGNNEYKPQNLDDINLYQSFQDWQIKSKTLLDHLTVVIQNLKDSAPKGVDKAVKKVKEVQSLPKVSQYNPFFSQPQVKSNTLNSINKAACKSFPITQTVQKQENLNYHISSQFQSQEIQFPKNIANIFSSHNQSNWKPGVPETNQKKSSDILWEIPQNNQQTMFSMQSVQSEKKQRKKWTITMPEFQGDTTVCQVTPNQGLPIQPTQAAGPMPTINFQYVTQNKAPVDNLMMQPINFFGNQYNAVPQNIQSLRDNSSQVYSNFCQPQTIYANHNLKQSPKRKGNVNLKPEEQFHKDIINPNTMYNRVNICNPQMQIPLLQNSMNPNPFGIMDESKTNIIYQNFCIGDGKNLPPTNTSYGAPFIQNDIFPTNAVPGQNMFCHKTCDQKTMLPLPLTNCDGDDSSEEYYPVKSYMKPGSYRVPNKSKSLVMQSTNNLNYIFDDVLVTGITVPFTKSNIFSQSKKTPPKTVNTNEKSIQTNRSEELKNTDLAWKAALASAEELGKSLISKQEQSQAPKIHNSPSLEKSSVQVQANSLDEISKTVDNSHSFDSASNNSSIDNSISSSQNKPSEIEVIKTSSVKTDDWLIQSLSKLEIQSNSKESTTTDSLKLNEIECCSTKTCDSKSRTSDSKNNESEESDNTINDIDSGCCSPKDKRSSQKKDKCNGVKQKMSTNLKSVSILQKPREYCHSRTKPWDKTREFSYQVSPYKSESRNIHKSPANWIKFNRKCINRHTLFKLQDILNTLSKMETSNGEVHKVFCHLESRVQCKSFASTTDFDNCQSSSCRSTILPPELTSNHENLNRVINVSAVNYKLKSRLYENIDQILVDIRQMFVNGRDVNKECSKTIEMINKLEFCFDELVEKHFGQPEYTDNRESQNGALLSIKHRRTQKVQRKVN